MTDLDGLLVEVSIRTDGSHHWTGESKLTISDADLAKELAAAVRALRDRPCPHIETSDGTSHCTLAEAANTAWAARWQEHLSGLFAALDRLDAPGVDDDDLASQIADGLQKMVIEVRNLRAEVAFPDRPGGTDNPTSDLPSYEPPRDALGMYTTAPFHEPTGGDGGR